MTIPIVLDTAKILNLDFSEIKKLLNSLSVTDITEYEQKFHFDIDFQRDETDPRELSEIPEIRLWFVRLDAAFPWLPFFLDWKGGELARFTAMLVPHQFSRSEGIIFNPEALEIFVMQKIFILSDWLQQQELPRRSRLKSMAKLLGYELDDNFLDML